MSSVIKLVDRRVEQVAVATSPLRVGLVQVNNSFSGQNYLPYSIACLRSYIEAHAPKAARYTFLPMIYKRMPVRDIVAGLKQADVIGFSTYVWNANISLEAARRLKQQNPDVVIVFGGPQVPDKPEQFLRQHPFIDIVVHNEGERMLDYALDRYVKKPEGGFLFFYFSTVDLCCHMMWRHFDEKHPHYDPAIAAQSSEWWTKRAGSTWKDSVFDLYIEMDRVLGHLRERLPPDATLIVMSDHGFAPYTRKFSLNTWLLEQKYLVLKPGLEREKPSSDPSAEAVLIMDAVDWSKTRAYGIGFNALYLNLAGRETNDPKTPEDEAGIVAEKDVPALLAELKSKLEAIRDPKDGARVILRCDLASEVYQGARAIEAPDMIVGYNSGYDNSDEATQGRIPNEVLSDNLGGTFNGSHLMAPDVVMGTLLSNRAVLPGQHGLEDLTVEILARYGIGPEQGMVGHRVLEQH